VSQVRPWSGGEVESRVTVSQVVVDDRCRRSAMSARRVVVDPRRAKQQARWRAPRWSDLQRGGWTASLCIGGSLTASLCIGGGLTALAAGRTASCGDPGRRAEGNSEEPEAPVVVRAWEPRGAQTRKELSGWADKPA
jgi:hypothetical protein